MKSLLTYHDYLPDSDFRLSIQVLDLDGQPIESHSHEFAELVVVLRHEGLHQVNGEVTYPIHAGDVFIINPHTQHAYCRTKGLRVCNILYDPDQFLPNRVDVCRLPGFYALFYLEPFYRVQDRFASRLRLDLENLNRVQGLIAAMLDEQQKGLDGYQSMMRGLFWQLVVDLSRCYSRQRAPASQKVMHLSHVIAYVESHYREPLNLDLLARVAHMSKNHLLRSFRRIFNTSPIDYIIRLRLAEACRLIDAGGRTISEIAYEVGFSDSNYFSRQFRRIYGVSPRAYHQWLTKTD